MARYFVERTPYWYEFTMEGEQCPMACYFTDKDEMFVEISKRYAFSDCEPMEITLIVCDGEEVWYDGWAPGMYYSFSNVKDEVVWEGSFPSWEH